MSMLHFRMGKFAQSYLVLIPYLLTYSQQCFVTTLLRHIVFMRNVFCFNDFNQIAIILRYSAHIKPCKTIKTMKIENIMHKRNMTLILSSQSIAVNKQASME